ncbi:MAG TPA: glutathione synthase [bacterium]|nr:glutathione synthase [bacterium]
MSTDRDVLAALADRLDEAVDYALLQGLLKYTPQGTLAHAPFALTPSPLPSALHAQMVALTAPFGRLVHAVARDVAFLEEALASAARVDPFTARLLAMAREGRGQRSLFLAVTRSDYFVHQPTPEVKPALRQVELNTISASYPGLSPLVARLHRYLLLGTPLEARVVPNDPLPAIADGFAQAWKAYGHPDARVLMIVQPGEANVFDQRLLEAALRGRGLITRRLPLEAIARSGRLREGHLVVDGEVMAIAYFRAAYGPEDFPSEDAFRARALIEASSAISVPDLHTQLAGAKKVQQVLTDPAVLGRFLASSEAQAVPGCFAAQYALEQPVRTPQGDLPAWELARARPTEFVLKPQREGGGHNAFDAELVARLNTLPPEERPAYVLMERIRPARHVAVLVRERQPQTVEGVSEIGRFGVYLADGERELLNTDAGYLVRTKGHDVTEGGVSAGFGYLDSLLLTPDAPA